MTFPAHRATDNRACAAQTVPGGAAGSGVTINNLVPAVVGDMDTHNMLGQLINVLPHNVKIGGIDAIPSIVSMASPDVQGIVPHPQGLPIPIQGSPNVFIGSGTGSAGIGMMQQLGLGSFGALSIGELVSVAGQVIGMVQNFTQLGGGAAIAQMNNLQGSPISPGTTVTGQTSGYKFTFANYFDSRVFNNVPGGASYGAANAYANVATVSNALVTDSGDYIVIQDYFTYGMNLTASVITT